MFRILTLLVTCLSISSSCRLTALSLDQALQHSDFRVGILCSEPQEADALIQLLQGPTDRMEVAGRPYFYGQLWGIPTVITCARVGKVASAITTAHMISLGQVQVVLSFGTAGSLSSRTRNTDALVATSLMQWDLDGRPMIRQYHVPILEMSSFLPDPTLSDMLTLSLETFLPQLPKKQAGECHRGLLVTGDQFIHDNPQRRDLQEDFPGVIGADMEAAAIAQACEEHQVPYGILRFLCNHCDKYATADCLFFWRDRGHQYLPEIVRLTYQQFFQRRDLLNEMELDYTATEKDTASSQDEDDEEDEEEVEQEEEDEEDDYDDEEE